ncbi:TPA: hypothetical protein N0F65_008784 [Lagenidium giganteum]|uniref:Uncharacterized protein n=1 Tax=Lagenidium giganteum TaxID=4803 RepID=A0AAV2YY02_9STRA|nr:TPA: hypothetical protein N0F65_008784 [Lagenidium giganteum]
MKLTTIVVAVAAAVATVVADGADVSVTGATCQKQCAPFQLCDVYNGEEYCKDTCAPGRCAANEDCKLHQVQCVRAPCPPIAQCVPKATTCTLQCGEFQQCDIYKGEQYCKDVCAPGRCSDSEVCKLKQVQCIRAPCPPIAECVPQPACSKQCGANQRCYTYNNKQYCADVCTPERCPQGQTCELVKVQCLVAPCPRVAQCVA